MKLNKEHVKTLVQEEFKRNISSKNINTILIEHAHSSDILEEGLVSMVASVVDWFKDNKTDEVKFMLLKNRHTNSFVYITELAKKIEVIEFDQYNTIIDRQEIPSVSEYTNYVKLKKDEGYVNSDDVQTIKKAIKILVYGIGIAVIAGGIGSVLGPSLVVVAGWLFDIITFIGSGLWTALSWTVKTGVSLVGGIGGIGDGAVGHAIKETVKGVGILSITTVGGFTAIKLASRIEEK